MSTARSNNRCLPPSPRFSGSFWRYTIPDHGVIRWKRAFEMLAEAGYKGCVCVELEDHFFNGREETEKTGLVASSRFFTEMLTSLTLWL